MKKSMRVWITALLVIVLAFAFAACGSSDSSSEDTGEAYVAALEPTFPPFDTTDADTGDLTGFDVDLVNAIAEDQGFTVEWKNMEFDGLIPALTSGNVDIVASGLSITEERAEQVDFSDSYYDSGLSVAVALDNDTIGSIEDLNKDTVVGVQIGTTGAKKANALKEDGQITEVKEYNGLDVAFQDLQNGAIDAVINDNPVTQNYMMKQPDTIKVVGDIIDADSYAIAVQKGSDLLEKINAGLASVKENGTYDELFEKWELGSSAEE